MAKEQSLKGIAIIGTAGRFPGARNTDEFWDNLKNGVESVGSFTDEEVLATGVDPQLLKHPDYVKSWGVMDDADLFDANYFGIPGREAEAMDPQHRHFLEVCVTALENAGYDPETYGGYIGLVSGVGISTYLLRNIVPNADHFQALGEYLTFIGNDKDFMPTRVSYKLNLKGPSHSVSTACSTTMVAIHLACQQLLTYQSDIVLAGGANIKLPQKSGYLYRKGHLKSPDGKCRAFDAKAGGAVFGNGVAVVALKRLSEAVRDGDHIYATIKSTALNNDGSSKAGYTAPSVTGQSDVIAQAHALAGFPPETITHMEAHGTGTELGDPVEIKALNRVFKPKTDKRQFCAITSLKTNIGHLDNVAGVASMIKLALTFKNKQIPPSLNFEKPNPEIDFEDSPFYVNDKLQDWNPPAGVPRRACISSFGAGGTNGHAVLEEAPDRGVSSPGRPWQLLVMSAKTPSALETIGRNLAEYLQHNPDVPLADIAYTLAVGRQALPYRAILVCQDVNDAIVSLVGRDPEQLAMGVQGPESSDDNARVAHMVSALGSQDADALKQHLLDIGNLWLVGAKVDWLAFYKGETRFRMPLPTYPFEGKRYWIDMPEGLAVASEEAMETAKHHEHIQVMKKKPIDEWFYAPTWLRSVRPSRTAQDMPHQRWMVFQDEHGVGENLVKSLKEQGYEVISVHQSTFFDKRDDDTYAIDPAAANHFNGMLTELNNLDRSPDTFVHLWNLTEARPDSLEKALTSGFNSLIFLAQAINVQHYGKDVQILSVSNNTQEIDDKDTVYPEKATIMGPVRVISQEMPNIFCRSIDLSLTEDTQLPARQLFTEAITPTEDRVIAYRGNRRWVQSYEMTPMTDAKPISFRENGVFLITGGLGGIGLVLADLLAQQQGAKLILTGRSALPPREDWDALLASNTEDDAVAHKIKAVQALEAKGAEVATFAVDVADRDGMADMIAQAEEAFGSINGVIHAAGIAGVSMIYNATEDITRKYLAPKLEGTLNLGALFKNHQLDFMTLCSSLASAMGGYGQVSYVAANAFLDAFAASGEGPSGAVAINWDAWKEVGMAAGRQTDSLQSTGILSDEGQQAFHMAISSGLPQVMVSTRDLQARIKDSYHLDMKDLEEVKDSTSAYPRPELTTPYAAPTNPLEQMLADTWQHMLGISKIGINDDFFELGGDSLKGMNLVNALEKQLGAVFHIEALFETSTIAALGVYLKDNYAAQISDLLGFEIVDDASAQNDQVTEAGLTEFRQLFPVLPDHGRAATPKNKQAVFVLAPPRSGTTLFRVLLAGNPALFAPPELFLLNFNTMQDRAAAFPGQDAFWLEGLVQAMMQVKVTSVPHIQSIIQDWEKANLSTKEAFAHVQDIIGDRLLVDKTPPYAYDLQTLKRAEEDFREPLYFHLTRHPYGMIRSYEAAKMDLFLRRRTRKQLPSVLAIGEMIWTLCHQNILEFLGSVPAERQKRVSFEEIVKSPETELRDLCRFLGVDFAPQMLNPYKEKSMRMTDGIYTGSKMLGDMKFHDHKGIDPEVADRWKKFHKVDFLSDLTWDLAESFGYERTATTTAKGDSLDEVVGARKDAQDLLKQVDDMDSGQVDDLLSQMLNS